LRDIEMEYEEHLPEHSTSLAMFPIAYHLRLQRAKEGKGDLLSRRVCCLPGGAPALRKSPQCLPTL